MTELRGANLASKVARPTGVQTREVKTMYEFGSLKITQWATILDPHAIDGLINSGFSESGSVLVAIANGSPVGYIIMDGNDLFAIETREGYKRQGIATKLCQAAKVKRAWGAIEDASAALFESFLGEIQWEDCRQPKVMIRRKRKPLIAAAIAPSSLGADIEFRWGVGSGLIKTR